jgi:uncharacterized protein (TIGR02391 family)
MAIATFAIAETQSAQVPSSIFTPKPSLAIHQSLAAKSARRSVVLSTSNQAWNHLSHDPTRMILLKGMESIDCVRRSPPNSQAIEAAVKALNNVVRLRSGLNIDGTTLMERAFSPSNPILRFNDLADKTDKDEQLGFMWLFSGVVMGLRNPRAHKIIHDDPEEALEFISFISLLAKLAERAAKV